METGDRFEDERASREARESVAGRPGSSRRSAIAEAMKRYLGAQSYRDQDPQRSRGLVRGKRAEEGTQQGTDRKDEQPGEQ